MNGVHDMGGMHGFGPVVREEDEPVFHETWEGRVYTMLRELNTKYPPNDAGAGRDIIEHIEPATYLTMSYYERFLRVLEKRAVAGGLLTESEIEERQEVIANEGGDPVPSTSNPEMVQRSLTRLFTSQPRPAEGASPPRFEKGQPVVVRNLNWPGHNRLPRYIRGKRGVVERVNGAHRIEDAHADALGPDPQTVYTVRFDGTEVWGADSETNLMVCMELWEGYLQPREADTRGSKS
jgi:nitrile hydratase beta subunit